MGRTSLLDESLIFPILFPRMDKTPPRNWLYIISLCVIAMAAAIFGIIDAVISLHDTGGESGIVVIVSFLFLVAVVIIDVIVRLLVRKRAGLLWLIEIVLLAVNVLIFKNRFW
jgi:hypothetical protein